MFFPSETQSAAGFVFTQTLLDPLQDFSLTDRPPVMGAAVLIGIKRFTAPENANLKTLYNAWASSISTSGCGCMPS